MALYFACIENEDMDGAMYILCYAPDESNWYRTIVFSELLNIKRNESISISNFAKRLYNNYFELRECFEDYSELSMHIVSFLDQGIMVYPNSTDYDTNIRLKRQKCKCYYENVLKFRNGNVGIIAFL